MPPGEAEPAYKGCDQLKLKLKPLAEASFRKFHALELALSNTTSIDAGGVVMFRLPEIPIGVPSVLTDFDSAKRGKNVQTKVTTLISLNKACHDPYSGCTVPLLIIVGSEGTTPDITPDPLVGTSYQPPNLTHWV